MCSNEGPYRHIFSLSHLFSLNLDWRLYCVVLLQMSTEQLLSSLILHAYFIAFGYSHLISRPSFYSTASFVPYVFCYMCPCWPCCCRIMTICLCFCSLNQAKPKLHLRISKQLFVCGVVSWTFSQYSNPVGIFSSSLFCLYVVGGNIWTYLDSHMNRSLVWLADHLFGLNSNISLVVMTTFQTNIQRKYSECHFISKKGKSGSNSRSYCQGCSTRDGLCPLIVWQFWIWLSLLSTFVKHEAKWIHAFILVTANSAPALQMLFSECSLSLLILGVAPDVSSSASRFSLLFIQRWLLHSLV